MELICLTMYGDPVSKGRPRMGRNGHAYTPERTRAAERALIARVQEWMAKNGQEPASGPVGLEVTFYCATRRRSDGDNLLKLVTDAMNALVYVDDMQIEDARYRVVRGVGKVVARTEIRVWSLEPAVLAQPDPLP